MTEFALVLGKGKDKAVRNRHPWIFSGAVARTPAGLEDGGLAEVRSEDGEILGHAYVNRRCSILARMVSFGAEPPLDALRRNLDGAWALRSGLVAGTSDAFRVVHGEGDGLPGLVVDKYADVCVIQVTTLGMERLKPVVLERLRGLLKPRVLYEKSSSPARREEGLADAEGALEGTLDGPVEIVENGRRFLVDIERGQKTGFFLDQREMRELVVRLSPGRRVLNAFSYTGGFSVCALAGGALRVDAVDTSEAALALARRSVRLNGLEESKAGFEAADVFGVLRRKTLDYDFIILDPPAFAKKKTDVVPACRGYKDINRLAMLRLPPGGLLLTFSCSHFVDEALFRRVLFQAAREADRTVRILQKHRMAFDHPLNVYHPESEYLKGFLLHVA
ncbi:MAG: class I SAM-dependent rRNA methyltransferase [Candidatus Aminicenantes bacterium]|nr:class I SAM-dependent rRNA methyltransferase [Candidatus Aminicenantes bacterium]